ncbi:MAG: leucine-rich repeat domain-containing protein, partial [Bacteroidales bacterium]|nr:leucine-rich repeat domain-containing protein [Bacteroidales bacterium]
GCSGLKSVEIPSSVTSIGNYAFLGCRGLESVEIPSSATSIGDGAFAGCSGLESIKVDKNNTRYDSRGDCNAIIETVTNTIVAGCKNTVIPSSVTRIGERAFQFCSGLESVEIPSSVTSIGGAAFSDCSGLESVEIPSSVTSISDCAFSYCSGLSSVVSLSKKPQVLRSNAFYEVVLRKVTLYVPKEAVESYKSAYIWKGFGKIVGIDSRP